MGNGPDDILYGQFIDKVGERCFQVVDGAGQKTLVYNLDSILKTIFCSYTFFFL